MRVVDNGRGIPVAIHPTEGRPTVEVVMTILHAGGKFGGAGYAVSGGLHGVGISVVNALSTRVEVGSSATASRLAQDFSDGGKPLGELQKGEPTDETGTTQTFWADAGIFETTEYDFETLRARFQQMAFLNKGLQHHADRRAPGRTSSRRRGRGGRGPTPTSRNVTYKYDGGLVDYVKHLNSAKKVEVVHPEIIDFESEDTERRMSLEIAMQWTNALLRVGAHVRQHDHDHRGRHARGGLPCRDDHPDQPLRAGARGSSRRRTRTSRATTSARA